MENDPTSPPQPTLTGAPAHEAHTGASAQGTDETEAPAQPRPSHPPVAAEELKRDEHRLTRLLALSFDAPASPSIRLKALAQRAPASASEERDMPYGWGFAWYPSAAPSALVVKDPTSIGDNPMSKLLSDWERFESTLFVCHLRGAARTLGDQDTHPFCRSFGGRDWVFAHNGDLERDWYTKLDLGDDPSLEPVGRTDSERIFCWILAKLRSERARRLADVGWEKLHGWFREIDQLGTVNAILTDGFDLVVYCDEDGYNPLHFARLVPPHEALAFDTHDVEIDLADAGDRTRTLAMVATQPFEQGTWSELSRGSMLALRRGAVVFDSHANENQRSRMVAPRTGGPQPDEGPARNTTAEDAGGVESGEQLPGRGTTSRRNALSTAARGPTQAEENRAAEIPLAQRVPSLELAPSALALAREHPGRLLSVVHDTVYRYTREVEKSAHQFRLKPAHDLTQEVLAHELTVNVDGLRRDYEDVFGNAVTRMEIERAYKNIRITSRALIRVNAPSGAHLHSPQRRFTIPLVWMPWQRQMMHAYLLPPELPETQLTELYEYALSFAHRQDNDLVQTLLDLNETIYRDYKYVSGSTTLETTPFDVYATRRGVCQDFANLLICLARLLGVPARYRVGYIYTGASYENKIQSEASHAWAELYLPWTGWLGFDPTNGCLANNDHVRVAAGRNYRDATPTAGTIYKGGGYETLAIDVRVEAVP